MNDTKNGIQILDIDYIPIVKLLYKIMKLNDNENSDNYDIDADSNETEESA